MKEDIINGARYNDDVGPIVIEDGRYTHRIYKTGVQYKHEETEMTENKATSPEVDFKKFMQIKFQDGPIKENGVNGCQIEDVINVLMSRLADFQQGDFVCKENAHALGKLMDAKICLEARTNRRTLAGVEGTSESMDGEGPSNAN